MYNSCTVSGKMSTFKVRLLPGENRDDTSTPFTGKSLRSLPAPIYLEKEMGAMLG